MSKAQQLAQQAAERRWTPDKRLEQGLALATRLVDLVRADKLAEAVTMIASEFSIIAIGEAAARERLEGRIAVLEAALAASKPRVRLRAVLREET